MLPVFTDVSQYLVTGRSRFRNQLKIETTFTKICDYLNANGLELNEAKTGLTEFMVCQKRMHLRGIPPELMASERLEDKDRIKFIDKHITTGA